MILDFPSAYWELANDITLTSEWQSKKLNFSGSLNGNGYTISGIVLISGEHYCYGGFFYENSGLIKNLSLEGTADLTSRPQSTVTPSTNCSGFFIYSNSGTIENCSVNAEVLFHNFKPDNR
ncbi:MAG: hypothetical protein LIO44_02765 [Eubacterium sp.]|nr:hypothetical protein [Eubacterium sp.]